MTAATVAAAKAVSSLHSPVPTDQGVEACEHCTSLRQVHIVRWPCPTRVHAEQAAEAASADSSADGLTAAELGALPVGSVVLNHQGRAFQRYEPRREGPYLYSQWMCPDGGYVRDDSEPHMLAGSSLIYSPSQRADQ